MQKGVSFCKVTLPCSFPVNLQKETTCRKSSTGSALYFSIILLNVWDSVFHRCDISVCQFFHSSVDMFLNFYFIVVRTQHNPYPLTGFEVNHAILLTRENE